MINQFIKNIVECLEFENIDRMHDGKSQLDIPFMIATLYQRLSDKEYSSFVEDLSKYDYSIDYFEGDNEENYYTDGYILIQLSDKTDDHFNSSCCNYKYKIIFNIDERFQGYCFCKSTDEDYDDRYKCCGHDCDWDAPQFILQKIENIGSSSFDGDQHDFWNFKDKFNETCEEEEKKLEIQLKIKQLQIQKENIEKEIEKLKKENQ